MLPLCSFPSVLRSFPFLGSVGISLAAHGGLIHRYAGLLLRRYVLHDPLASFSIASLSSLLLDSLARRLPLYSCVYFLSPQYSTNQSICLLLHLYYKLIYNYPGRVIYSDVWELGALKCASYAAHRGDFGSIVTRAKETARGAFTNIVNTNCCFFQSPTKIARLFMPMR